MLVHLDCHHMVINMHVDRRPLACTCVRLVVGPLPQAVRSTAGGVPNRLGFPDILVLGSVMQRGANSISAGRVTSPCLRVPFSFIRASGWRANGGGVPSQAPLHGSRGHRKCASLYNVSVLLGRAPRPQTCQITTATAKTGKNRCQLLREVLAPHFQRDFAT